MAQRMSKRDKEMFSAGCKVGARNAKKSCTRKKTSYR